MKARTIQDNGRPIVELTAETDEDREAIDRLVLGHGVLGKTIVATVTDGPDVVVLAAIGVSKEKWTEEEKSLVFDLSWEIPNDIREHHRPTEKKG